MATTPHSLKPIYDNYEKDHPEPASITITGTVPQWLNGNLYRNGPGMLDIGDATFGHWFDGMGLLHKYSIKDGAITYRNRFLESEDFKVNMAANSIVAPSFGTIPRRDPNKSLFKRFTSYFKLDATDNANVNVLPVGTHMFAINDGSIIHEFDPETLSQMERIEYDKVTPVFWATAHAHTEPDGTVHNVGFTKSGPPSGGKGPHHCFFKIPPPNSTSAPPFERVELVAAVPAKSMYRLNYYHSFGITENYYIVLEQPIYINILKLLTQKVKGVPANECMDWCPNEKVGFIVVDRRSGKRVNPDYNYTADTFFCFHHINAYEERGHLVVDICSNEDDAVLKAFTIDKVRYEGEALREFAETVPKTEPRRYVLPLNLDSSTQQSSNLVSLSYTSATAILGKDKAVSLTYDVIGGEGTFFDLPQINYNANNGKMYQYVYGLAPVEAASGLSTLRFKLIKIDVMTKETLKWEVEGHFPAEPVFVANPAAASEDDGVLLSVVLQPGSDSKPYLLILDAGDMTEMARATLPFRIPRDIHGVFHPNS